MADKFGFKNYTPPTRKEMDKLQEMFKDSTPPGVTLPMGQEGMKKIMKALRKIRGMKDGGLAQAIEKVKAKEMKGGGEAVPPKFKGFSKLPESVQQKMNPDLAEKFGMGGDVKGKKSGNICRGRGIARPGTGFTIR